MSATRWARWRWESHDPARRRARYYELHLHEDLWGCWELEARWGRIGARLGGARVHPLGGREEARALVLACHRRRLAHRYTLVDGEPPA